MSNDDKKAFIKGLMSNSYMELDGEEDDELTYTTRENGDVGSETPGKADLAECKLRKEQVIKAIPDVMVDIEPCDEWMYLTFKLN